MSAQNLPAKKTSGGRGILLGLMLFLGINVICLGIALGFMDFFFDKSPHAIELFLRTMSIHLSAWIHLPVLLVEIVVGISAWIALLLLGLILFGMIVPS